MTFKFQKRRGIGNVITTLIILIASVVLGAGVIFFGGSMFQTNTQQESMEVANVHAWVGATNDTSTTAFVVQNTGSKPITLNSINVRGISVATTSWNYCTACATATNIATPLPADYTETSVTIGGTPYAMTSGALSLTQGQAAIVYLNEAGSIESIDAGNTYAVQVEAGLASSVIQTLVEVK